MIIVLLEPAFLFFVLTSGRPNLPVTTFFVFSKPLCSHFAVQTVIREFSAPLQKRCLSLSKGFPLQPKFTAAAAQRFYSSFVALLEAILQRCSFRTGRVPMSPSHFYTQPNWTLLSSHLFQTVSFLVFVILWLKQCTNVILIPSYINAAQHTHS